MKDVADNVGKWDYDAENNKIINLGEPTNQTDASTKDYVDLKIAPLSKKVQNLGSNGEVLSLDFNPYKTPQAIATQKQVKENGGKIDLGSLETNYQNNLSLANQNTQLDNLEIGERIIYRDYSNKSLAVQHLIINNTQKDIPIPNLNTWVNEYDFTVAINDKYIIKQLFYFKLLFTSTNKKFRVASAIHNATTGVILGTQEQDFDFSKYTNDEIKDQVFNWFKETIVDLETGYTYVFRMTLQGLDNTEGTFSPVVYTSAPHVYDLTKKSYLEILKLSLKGGGSYLPTYKNQNFQSLVSTTETPPDDNYERTVKGWRNNPISSKTMFTVQTNGGIVIDETYRQEIATSKTDRKIRVDFGADGFINSDGEYYAKFDVSGAFDFGGNKYVLYSNKETGTTGYNGRNLHQTGTAFFTIPHDIAAGGLLFVLIKVIRAATGDISQPYNLTFTEMGNTGTKGTEGRKGDTGDQGPKGDKGDIGPIGPQGPKGDPATPPIRTTIINNNQNIGNNSSVIYTTLNNVLLHDYKNIEIKVSSTGVRTYLKYLNTYDPSTDNYIFYILNDPITSKDYYKIEINNNFIEIFNNTGGRKFFNAIITGERITTRENKIKRELKNVKEN